MMEQSCVLWTSMRCWPPSISRRRTQDSQKAKRQQEGLLSNLTTQIFPVANSNFTQRRTSMNSQDDLRQRYPMNRRTFVSMVAAGAASTLFQGNAAAAQPAPEARNVVLVHGLFGEGSSW